jgi:type I restriction enzyme M protein
MHPTRGKSGGEYYTPQEVSELLTRLTIVGKPRLIRSMTRPADQWLVAAEVQPKSSAKRTCGRDFSDRKSTSPPTTLCRINMFLHDIGYDKFDIGHGDTLTDPLHWDDEPFEAIVSNPPYSIKWKGDK